MNRLLKFILLFICFPIALNASGVSGDTLYVDSIAYIKIHESNFSIRPYFITKYSILTIDDVKTDSLNAPRIEYMPNSRTAIGISGGYKGFILGLAVQMPYSKESLDIYGRTNYTDLQFSLYGRRLGGDVYYQKYRGFYLRNVADFDSTWSDTMPHPKNRDLAIRTTGLNFFYIHDKKFSFKAAFGHTERQLKSAGSFLMLFSVRNSSISNEYSLVPDSFSVHVTKADSLRGCNFTTLSLVPGYGHTFVHNELYLSFGAMMGLGVQFQKYKLLDHYENGFQPVLKLNLRGSMGYNGEKQYIGVSFNIDTNTIPIDDINMNIILYSWRFAFGFRF